MNVLVTAGNTQVFIDRVRCLTNVFTGRTGAGIALEANRRGHAVTLLTSHPEAIAGSPAERWRCIPYRTFDDLHRLMEQHIHEGGFDAVIHCAAVSDYLPAGVFAPESGTSFGATNAWTGQPPRLLDRAAGKVKSDDPELWLRLVRAPKLVDRIRSPWGFRGTLVKFKLEVDMTDERLLEIAERSRRASDADWMVANTLEGAADWAYLGSAAGYRRVARTELAPALLHAVEGARRG